MSYRQLVMQQRDNEQLWVFNTDYSDEQLDRNYPDHKVIRVANKEEIAMPKIGGGYMPSRKNLEHFMTLEELSMSPAGSKKLLLCERRP